MYEEVFRHILLPTYEKLRGRSSSSFAKEYESQQYLFYEELKKIQFSKLKELVSYSFEHVNYYNNLWKKIDFHPTDLTEFNVFEELPFLTKDIIKNNYNDLIATPHKHMNLKKTTGGSTGAPLSFEYTKESYERRNAVMWRGYSWAKMLPGRKATFLWGTNIGEVSPYAKYKEGMYHKIYGRQMLSCFDMDKETIEKYVKRINQRKPKIIVSYVNPIYMLAKWVAENNIEIHSPMSIITGAEPLHDFQRTLIKKVFNTDVFNTYGSREFMLMASECDCFNGMHMNIDHLVMETVNTDGLSVQNEIGEVAVTDLHNYGMPFIRYKNEDMAIISDKKCECGRGLPLMDKVIGRTLDCIYTSDGKILPGEFFPHFLKDFSGLDKFQVIQKDINNVEIKLIVRDKFSTESAKIIESETRKALGDKINIEVNLVDDIPLTSSGKYRVTISNLNH